MATSGFAFLGLSRHAAPGLEGSIGNGLAVAPTGMLALVSGDDAVRQSVLMLLSTRPGERVMRPDYGCPIHRLLFGPNDATTAGLAIHYVRQALLRFEPRIEIVRIDAGRSPYDESGATLLVSLDYRVRDTRHLEQLALELRLDGGAP